MNLRSILQHRLLHTSAIRLALRYALFYALLITLGLGVLYWAINHYVDAQIRSALQQEILHLKNLDRQGGQQQLIARIHLKQQSGSRENKRYYLLQSSTAKTLAGNLLGWPSGLKADGKVRNIWIEDAQIPGHVLDDDGFWPMIAVRLDNGSRLLIAQGVSQAEDLQEFILSVMAIILFISVTLAVTMGWLLGRTILQRIDVINHTAQQVSAGQLSTRLTISQRHDEFDELASHLNAMLDRINHLLSGMRQVTDNVAHDLRRPLTRLRNRLEVTLLEQREADEYRRVMKETLQDANELMQTFNALLEIAQTEAGSFRGSWEAINISALLAEIGELYKDEAEALGKKFLLQIQPALTVMGNRQLLAQAVSNLLDNAFKYTTANAHISLQAEINNEKILLTVADDGPGIPAEQYDKVLQRFVRLAPARNTEGNGLGLSLVKAVATLHNASLQLADNHPGLQVVLIFSHTPII